MVLTLAAVAGILATDFEWMPWSGAWLCAGAGMLLIYTLRFGHVWPLVPGCFLVFAFLHHTRLAETAHHPLRQALQGTDKPVEAVIRGSLLPEYDNTADGRAHALCTTQQITITGSGTTLHQAATLLLRLPHGSPFPGAGTYEMRGRLYLPRPPANPGGFDAQEYSLRLGRVARFDAANFRCVGDSGAEWWGSCLEAAERCRQWISAQLTKDLENDPETAAVIRAMALGVSAEADDEIEDAFRNSGTLHVFAVSGLHVALLGVIALGLLRQLGVRRGLSLALMLLAVFAYAFITGWRPSAARAAFMVAVFTCATFGDRESSLQNSLGAAALLLLGTDPHQLFMPGFQLSFGVLWLSSLGSTPLLKLLLPYTGLDPFLPPELASRWQLTWSACRRWVAVTFSVSLAAWVASLPFILGHFQSVTPVAVIANCVLVPLSFLCLTATCLSLCAAVVHATGVQVLFNNVNWAMASAMIASAAWFANLPGASFHFDPSGFAQQHLRTPAPAVWRVLRLPRGGAANHLRLANGQHWLFDVGDETSFRRVLQPALRSGGVNSITGVFLSHNDSHHIGALPQVMAAYHPVVLYCSTQEPGALDPARSALRQFMSSPQSGLLRRMGEHERLALSDNAAFKIEAEVLHPTPQIHNARGDDRAMVLMLRLGPWRLLWMSDAGFATEKLLCASRSSADLRCDLIIRSQHEGDISPSTEFLLKAAPRAILCGSDPRDPGAALPATLVEWAQQHDAHLLDTASDGSIEVQFTSEALHIIPYDRARNAIELALREDTHTTHAK